MKKQKSPVPPYHLVRMGTLMEEFQNEAAHFSQVMTNGAGIRTPHLLESIRKLEQLYLGVAIHLDYARAINGGTGITLDDGLDALEMIRQMDHDAEETSN